MVLDIVNCIEVTNYASTLIFFLAEQLLHPVYDERKMPF